MLQENELPREWMLRWGIQVRRKIECGTRKGTTEIGYSSVGETESMEIIPTFGTLRPDDTGKNLRHADCT